MRERVERLGLEVQSSSVGARGSGSTSQPLRSGLARPSGDKQGVRVYHHGAELCPAWCLWPRANTAGQRARLELTDLVSVMKPDAVPKQYKLGLEASGANGCLLRGWREPCVCY
jgi:hypothetical protein